MYEVVLIDLLKGREDEEKNFQNFQNCPSFEFFCDFFWQTLNFFFQCCYGQIFFKLCIHTLKNTYFHMSREKKYRFFPKARKLTLKKAVFSKSISAAMDEAIKNLMPLLLQKVNLYLNMHAFVF